MTAKGFYNQYLRCKITTDISPPNLTDTGNWNQAGLGLNGWHDIYDAADGSGLVPNMPLIFPTGKSGARDLNASKPVPGAQDPALGSLAFPVYPELSDPIIYSTLSTRTVTPTAGDAAQAAVTFASLATLTTQPTNAEQLVFTVSGASSSTGASITVLVNGEAQETVPLIEGANSNGLYYTQGGYGPTVTFTTAGTNDGQVAVSGIQYSTVNYKLSQDTPFVAFEQAGRIEVDQTSTTTTSEYFPGCKIPEQSFAFDRSDNLSLLQHNATVNGLFPTTAPASGFQDAASLYYRPFAAWFGTMTIDDVVNKEITASEFNINSGDEHFPVASGSRGPDNAVAGWFETFGTLTLIPQSGDRWADHIAGTGRKFELTFTSSIEIVPSVPYSIKFTWNDAYIETYERDAQGAAQGAGLTFRAVRNAVNNGAVEITIVGRIPE